MGKLETAVLYNCSTKIKAIGIFYLIQYTILALIYVIIGLCTGTHQISSNGMEISTAVFVGVMGVLSFKEDFKALLQNGYTRKYIFLSNICMFAVLAASMAVIDTVGGNLLHRFLPRYFTIFGLLYGYGHLFLNWLWLTAAYLLLCSLCYLAALVINKAGKTVSLLIGVGLAGLILMAAALFRFVFSPETVSAIGRFARNAMGFMNDGSQNLLFPILSFFAAGLFLGACSYGVLRRTELK